MHYKHMEKYGSFCYSFLTSIFRMLGLHREYVVIVVQGGDSKGFCVIGFRGDRPGSD